MHYYLRAGILVKVTAILMASVVRPLRREFYVAACLFYHLPKLEASFLHELVHVVIHFIGKLILCSILRVLY